MAAAVPDGVRSEATLADVLALEEIDRDIYRANLVYPDRWALYGGQVAAQALLAAGRTVGDGRVPHSLHCYFLRPGDAERPTVFRVERDRDGRSFSARRVVAIQGGKVVCSMSCSFAVDSLAGPDLQDVEAPVTGPPETWPEMVLPRMFQMDCRVPEQPYPAASWPTRLWARTSVALPDDPLVHAAVLTYFSDIASGTSAFEGSAERTSTSLDHAVWFHRPVRADDWFLYETDSPAAASGRALCFGQIWASDGTHVATVAQEGLIRSLEA
jgi:acyl-CoA thioesterase II